MSIWLRPRTSARWMSRMSRMPTCSRSSSEVEGRTLTSRPSARPASATRARVSADELGMATTSTSGRQRSAAPRMPHVSPRTGTPRIRRWRLARSSSTRPTGSHSRLRVAQHGDDQVAAGVPGAGDQGPGRGRRPPHRPSPGVRRRRARSPGPGRRPRRRRSSLRPAPSGPSRCRWSWRRTRPCRRRPPRPRPAASPPGCRYAPGPGADGRRDRRRRRRSPGRSPRRRRPSTAPRRTTCTEDRWPPWSPRPTP